MAEMSHYDNAYVSRGLYCPAIFNDSKQLLFKAPKWQSLVPISAAHRML